MDRTTLTERLRQAEAEIAAGHPEQALAYCQELQTAYPRALRVQRVLGEVYLALRRPREALAALDRALAGDPEDVRACCARALVHQMHGDDAAALTWYRRACDLRPDDQGLRNTYRDLARRLGEPPYRPSRAGLARLYLRGDLFAHAIHEWEQIVNASPDMLDAQVALAETLWRAGYAQAADDRCRRILANAPSCVKAMLIQMALALADEDMDSARAHFERTLQLDPEMLIAQACFADDLAAGHPVISAMLRAAINESAEHAAATTRITGGFAQSTPLAGQRNHSRPLVTSAPVTAGPIPSPQMPNPGQPLPPPPRPDVPVPSQPTEVTRAIKETAFMIWSQDEDSQPRLSAQHPAVTNNTADGSAASPILESMGAAADAETRQALNWFNWLQSQGAVAMGVGATPGVAAVPPEQILAQPAQQTSQQTWQQEPQVDFDDGDDEPTSVLPAAMETMASATTNTNHQDRPATAPKLTMPLPPTPLPPTPLPPTPLPPTRVTMPIAPMEMSNAELSDEEPITAPLPRPTAEALRTMFADLGADTAIMPAVQPDPSPAVQDDVAPPVAEPSYVVDADPVGSAEPLSAPEMPGGQTVPEVFASPQEKAPQTIEDLERQFSASGFSHIETRPGLLAEIEREQQLGQSSAQMPIPAASMPAEDTDAEEKGDASNAVRDEHNTISSAADVSKTIPSGPASHDYPARLAHARERREGGQLDIALNEYRAIIKNAPDLLPDVLSDLHASLEQEPDNPTLHSVLGDALVSQGDYEAALESFNRATELAQSRSEQE